MEVRWKLVGDGSFLQLGDSWKPNSRGQTWWQVSLPAEPSLWPSGFFKRQTDWILPKLLSDKKKKRQKQRDPQQNPKEQHEVLTVCLGYFSVTMIRYHDQGNVQKKVSLGLTVSESPGGMVVEQSLRAYILIHNLEKRELTGKGLGFWNPKACTQWYLLKQAHPPDPSPRVLLTGTKCSNTRASERHSHSSLSAVPQILQCLRTAPEIACSFYSLSLYYF